MRYNFSLNNFFPRFPPHERARKFGQEGSPEFARKVKEHRDFIIGKLEAITNRFISGIRSNLHSFPPSVARLLRSMYSLLMTSGRLEPREVNAVCVDVVFDLFICPAMVDPNPVGIIDTPISYIARSNLMQVAQILQTLALWKWEDVDPRLHDLYSRFDKEAMSSVLEAMLEAGEMSEEAEEMSEMAGASAFRSGETANEGSKLSRLALLLTRDQLSQLIQFLRSLRDNASKVENLDLTEVASLVGSLPENLPGSDSSATTNNNPISKSASMTSTKSDDSSSTDSLRSKKQALASRLSTAVNTGKAAVERQVKSKLGNDSSGVSLSEDSEQVGSLGDDGPPIVPRDPDTVLVIPLVESSGAEPPGFLSEEHVLTRSRQASRVVRMNLANLPGGSGSAVSEENSSFISGAAGEKRTRFSLSHDEGSIGNTSDNLEAISEAASNHSLASSLEDEVDAVEDPIIDNLSDMVSANVSGRGTPNVSGRDTPSSQVTNDDEIVVGGRDENVDNEPDGDNVPAVAAAAAPQPNNPAGGPRVPPPQGAGAMGAAGNPPRLQPARGRGILGGRKNGEPDLEEKFGRFEIKPPSRPGAAAGQGLFSEHGDETRSMVSDTWSTDVLGSDTETTTGDGERLLGDLDELSRNRMLDELVVPTSSAGGTNSKFVCVSSNVENLT